MAIFQPGPIIANIRGSIGGTTFSKVASGAIARVRRGPIQKTSTPRGYSRNLFGSVAQTWSKFTPADQLQWITFAAANPVPNRFGEMQVLSGMAMYMYLNALGQHFYGVSAALPPADLQYAPIEALDIICNKDPGGSITVEATDGAATTDDKMVLYISGPLGRGRTTAVAGYFMVPDLLALNAPVDVTAYWTARFGSLPQFVGNRVVCEALALRSTNGARSPRVKAYTRFV